MIRLKALLTENGSSDSLRAVRAPLTRPEQVKTFMAAYERALRSAVQKYPDEYGYPVSEVPGVVKRMEAAFLKGSYNHDSRAIKAAAKALGIKPTRTALEAFFNGAS